MANSKSVAGLTGHIFVACGMIGGEFEKDISWVAVVGIRGCAVTISTLEGLPAHVRIIVK
jgi:hypothetical protein